MSHENKESLHYFSILLRLSIGTLLLTAGLLKIPYGIDGTIGYYMSMFEKSLLPPLLIKAHASVIIFLEVGLGAWLLSGFKLRAAWIAAGVLLISLAVGMVFAGKYDVANDNYVYVLIAGLGLFLSSFDRWKFA